MSERNSFSYKLDAREQQMLLGILSTGNYMPVSTPYTVISVKAEDCMVSLYTSGKCLIQGKGARDFVSFVLEPAVLKKAELGYEDVLNADAATPHLGVDESGKGDFFGPMVIAGAYADEELTRTMRDMNVRDSKTVTSDAKILDMARDIRKLLGRRFTIVKIGPKAYNRLYMKMRSVNSMLAWAHARAIENLLEVLPDCPRAVADQFGAKKDVENALMKKGRQIELIQKHRAESDLAVAAASILARAEFVRSLKQMEHEHGMPFPKGASQQVKEAASQLAKERGAAILVETAKCHFKTTDDVLKTVNRDRSALGPEGQAVSKAARERPRPHTHKPQ